MKKICRSLLYMPADNSHMLEKVSGLRCDAVIFDLEDSVSVSNKELARQQLESTSVWHKDIDKGLIIRVNDVDSDFFYKDICLVARLKPTAIVLPKATEAAIIKADNLLTCLEKEQALLVGEIKLIPLIETAYGVCRAYEIGRSSPRINAMQFGAEDFTRDMQVDRTKKGEEIQQARRMMTMACRASGLEAIDTPFVDFKDTGGLVEDCRMAKQAGMSAKTCIHPNQIETVNQAFSPSQEEIAWAKRVVENASRPDNAHKGAFSLDGRMIDRPILARAQRIVEKANLLER